ncbi:hypothetical protein [Bacillus sp. FJAT-27251]|uniref:hypothetical protein n=1 Tax=Bacillus sp. FJAT-27251 TaxID=1684142 RepID=UPI0006A7D073|nr:hypothetical protein [Bacillus sp. FJAT-27251]
MKHFLLIIMSLLTAASLIGCQQANDTSIKDQIDFVPNEEYTGDPHPVVEVEMKLTEQEKAEFEQLRQEILAEKEGR